MNRKQRRQEIPHNHRIVLAKLAETANGPLRFFEERYFNCPKTKEMIIDGINSGEFKVDWETLDLLKVEKR